MTKLRPYVLGIAAFALGAALIGPGATATHQPANKLSASASVLEIMTADITSGTDSKVEPLLTGTLKTSATKDLVIQVTAECALWTDTKTVGDQDSEAIGMVKLWVVIDGTKVVPVTRDSNGDGKFTDPDDGRVVFCNRAFRQKTTNFTDDGGDDKDSRETIELFQRTRSANAFNWVALNMGKGVHTITVLGQLDVQVIGLGRAKALVGKRTLVVEPTSLANDVQV